MVAQIYKSNWKALVVFVCVHVFMFEFHVNVPVKESLGLNQFLAFG